MANINDLKWVNGETPLSAENLNAMVQAIKDIKFPTDLNNYQLKLENGKNIKTINGFNLLGSGNLVIGSVNVKGLTFNPIYVGTNAVPLKMIQQVDTSESDPELSTTNVYQLSKILDIEVENGDNNDGYLTFVMK